MKKVETSTITWIISRVEQPFLHFSQRFSRYSNWNKMTKTLFNFHSLDRFHKAELDKTLDCFVFIWETFVS